MKIISQLEILFRQFGFDFRKGFLAISEIPYFIKTVRSYARAAKNTDFPLGIRNLRPMLTDRKAQAGYFNSIYFFQDIWAARKIHDRKPARHSDVGSSIEGFVAHVLCFTSIEVIDIRPLQISMPGLTFVQEDATTLSRFEDNSIGSLSSLHAIEHFGLGRYGDPLSADAYYRAMRSLARVLMPNGRLYFSVPIGRQRVQFNSQRIFSPLTIIDIFKDLKLVSFSAVNDLGAFIEDARPEDFAELKCGCGMFEFTK
jgi:SAM-dependent methyltransferase